MNGPTEAEYDKIARILPDDDAVILPVRTSRYTPEEAAARYPKGLKPVTLKGGQEITAHAKGSCMTYWCPVHYPSNHHMNQWDQMWISSEQRMYRICPHVREHPDPDDLPQPGGPAENACSCECRCCERPFDINSEV
jgi:hypothetical protein